MKAGLIRCMQTENVCPASKCFEAMRERKGAFADIDEEITIVGVNTCGGCPGKNAAQRARHMVKRGADAIVLASCVTLGTPLNFPCPFHKKMLEIVREAVGEKARVFDYSHEPGKKKKKEGE